MLFALVVFPGFVGTLAKLEVEDSFTHGTSAQRVRWFKKGFETGDVSQGDKFNATQL